MKPLWIRVDANLRRRAVVGRAVEALGISSHEAMGMLVELWGNVAQHAERGHVGDVPDTLLEEWCGWRGKRGKCAAFLRAHHIDRSGVIHEWMEYNGKLEERRQRDRERKRPREARIAETDTNSAGIPQEIRTPSDGRPADFHLHVNGNGNGNGNENGKAVSTTAATAGEYYGRCVHELGVGMRAHPEIGARFKAVNASTQLDAVRWFEDGIPLDVALTAIRKCCAAYRPSSRRRQISSLRYCDGAVRERWAEITSNGVTSAADVPGARDATDAAWLKAQGYC